MEIRFLMLLALVVAFLVICGALVALVVWLVLRSQGGPRSGD